MAPFPRATSKAGKASRGPTSAATTPLTIRARPRVDARLEQVIRERAARSFGKWATLIERITIRFVDQNGPRGGVDQRCSLQIDLTGLEPLHVAHDASTRMAAFTATAAAAERALRRLLARRHRSAGRRSIGETARPRLADAPSMIGRREGRSEIARAMVRARPEKHVRDLWVDTAQPGTSETDRTAGGGHTARRNARVRRDGMTTLLEDSKSRPSRKSSRRSVNRGKPSHGKERQAVAESLTPTARSRRGRAR